MKTPAFQIDSLHVNTCGLRKGHDYERWHWFRKLLIATVSLALAGSTASAQQPGSLFRYIALSPRDTIWLGKPFLLQRFADLVTPGAYRLKQGTFGGAESIFIITTPPDIVAAIDFHYADNADFAEMLKGYIDWLGTPTSSDTTGPDQKVVWRDAHTMFELSVVGDENRGIVSSRMIDVAPDP